MQIDEGFLAFAARGPKRRGKIIRRRRFRVEFDRATKLPRRAVHVPIKNAPGFAEIDVRFRVAIVDLERIRRGVAHFCICLARRRVHVRQPEPRLGDTGPGAPELRILFQRAVEKLQTFAERFFAQFVR